MLPGGAAYVYFGAVAGDLAAAISGGGSSSQGKSVAVIRWVLMGAGVLATIGAVVLIGWLARRELMHEAAEAILEGNDGDRREPSASIDDSTASSPREPSCSFDSSPNEDALSKANANPIGACDSKHAAEEV